MRVESNGFDANLAPDAYLRWARHYLQCETDFSVQSGFSPVPYFLLSRVVELALKARHLETMTQKQVKGRFGHHLDRAYETLVPEKQILSSDQVNVLRVASKIYAAKGFEYFDPNDAVTGFSRYPVLSELRAIATKLCE